MSLTTATSTSSAYKKTLLRIGIGFFVAMVLLTFFSGTLNNLALAKVGVTTPQSGSLQKLITADGTFSSKEPVSVLLTAAGKVEEVLVEAGDVVKAGDVLVKMDMSDLQKQIDTEKNNLTKMENNQAKQKLTVAPDYTSQNVKIANDKKALDAAKAALTQAQADLAALEADPGSTPEQISAAQDAVTAAQTAKTNAQNTYDIDVAALNKQKKQDSNSKKSAALDAANAAIDLQVQKDKIATLEQQLAENTEVKAPVDGRIQTVNAQAGQQASTSQPLLTMLDSSKSLDFTVDLTNDDADLLYEGDQLDIHLTGLNESVTGTIREKKDSTAQPGTMTTVVFDTDIQDVLDNDVQPNQKGDIRSSTNTLSYNMTLPNGAIREDSSGYFVLVVQQKRTPLGNSLVLSRVDVTIVDSDSYHSAVSGALSQRDQVVTSSDKSVSDGDTVRMAS